MDFKIILSTNELIFVGWALGILEAKLVKKLKIDWGFAAFNFILCIVFWFCFEWLAAVEPGKTIAGQIFQVVIFLVLGYGVYKIFVAMTRAGVGGFLKAIPSIISGWVNKYSSQRQPEGKTEATELKVTDPEKINLEQPGQEEEKQP